MVRRIVGLVSLVLAVLGLVSGCAQLELPQAVAAPLIVARNMAFNVHPAAYRYRVAGFSPDQAAVIADAIATLSVRAHLPIELSDEGLPITATASLCRKDGSWAGTAYGTDRIEILRSFQGHVLWLVTMHEIFHSLGWAVHSPQKQNRLMSPIIMLDKVGAAPTDQDIRELRQHLVPLGQWRVFN